MAVVVATKVKDQTAQGLNKSARNFDRYAKKSARSLDKIGDSARKQARSFDSISAGVGKMTSSLLGVGAAASGFHAVSASVQKLAGEQQEIIRNANRYQASAERLPDN